MIHKTKLSTVETKLKELGIEQEGVWQEFNVILSGVTGYAPVYDENEIIEPDVCLLYLCSDQGFTINTPFKDFDKIMSDFLQPK